MSVIGTRPEAIKMAPIVGLLSREPQVTSVVCSTGQHREMLTPVLALFGVSPNIELNVMRADQSLAGLTSAVLDGISRVLRAEKPDLLLVQGDTTTAMAAAMAGFYENVPVGHVEAGLRTGNMSAPWPEEANRRLISVLAVLHFAPTQRAKEALEREGIAPNTIFVTGNTVIDALMEVVQGIDDDPDFAAAMARNFAFTETGRKLVLVTGHRRESFGEGFEEICQAISQLATRSDVEIAYPVHLNPRVQEPVRRLLGHLSNVHLLEPLDYRRFVYLMRRSDLILTDSGGVQEEAPSLGKPVLVMRDVTERTEALGAGTIQLVGPHCESIVRAANKVLDQVRLGTAPTIPMNPYGDGNAAPRIVQAILQNFSSN